MLLDSSQKKSLTALHPSPLHIFKLWQTFLQNVNPLIKLLHVPTAQQQILDAADNLPGVSKEFEALMFCIYCLAVVSLGEKEAQDSFGEEKTVLLSRYRRGAQLALAKAGLLRASSMVVMQAFLLYLVCFDQCSSSNYWPEVFSHIKACHACLFRHRICLVSVRRGSANGPADRSPPGRLPTRSISVRHRNATSSMAPVDDLRCDHRSKLRYHVANLSNES